MVLKSRVFAYAFTASSGPSNRQKPETWPAPLCLYCAAADVPRLPALLNRILASSDEPRRCRPVVFANRVQVRTKGGIPKIRAFIREQRRENRVHSAVVKIEVAAGITGKGELARRRICLKCDVHAEERYDART